MTNPNAHNKSIGTVRGQTATNKTLLHSYSTNLMNYGQIMDENQWFCNNWPEVLISFRADVKYLQNAIKVGASNLEVAPSLWLSTTLAWIISNVIYIYITGRSSWRLDNPQLNYAYYIIAILASVIKVYFLISRMVAWYHCCSCLQKLYVKTIMEYMGRFIFLPGLILII